MCELFRVLNMKTWHGHNLLLGVNHISHVNEVIGLEQASGMPCCCFRNPQAALGGVAED